MEEQGNERSGLPPRLARLLTPEYQREAEEKRAHRRELLESAERNLEEVGRLIDRLKR
jgi:hypothetical protein